MAEYKGRVQEPEFILHLTEVELEGLKKLIGGTSLNFLTGRGLTSEQAESVHTLHDVLEDI